MLEQTFLQMHCICINGLPKTARAAKNKNGMLSWQTKTLELREQL